MKSIFVNVNKPFFISFSSDSNDVITHQSPSLKNNSLNSVGDSNISSISTSDDNSERMMNDSFEYSNTEKIQVDSKKFENEINEKTPSKSISCQDCGKTFKGKQSLKFHIDTIHKGIKYSCNSCGKSYTQKAVLKRHVKTFHNGGKSSKFKQDNDESKNNLDSFGDNDTEPTTKKTFQISQNNDNSNDFEPPQLAINNSTLESFDIKSDNEIMQNTNGNSLDELLTDDASKELNKSVDEEEKPVTETNNDDDFEPPQLAINDENLKNEDLDNSFHETNDSSNESTDQSKDLIKSVHEEEKLVEETNNSDEFEPPQLAINASNDSTLESNDENMPKTIQETKNCEKCKKSFKSKQTLKVHNDSVHKGIKYSCETCGKSFTQKSALSVHMKNLHVNSLKTKQIDESKDALDSILNHSTFGTTLDVANNISNSDEDFTKDLSKVEKSIKVEPEEIDPVSLLEVQLSTWMDEKVSVDEKSYKCESCEKSYNFKQNLNHHVRTVHEGKTHKCVHCGKEFARPDFLKKHKSRVHNDTNLDENVEKMSNGMKIHKCKSCPKSYSSNDNLRAHIKTVHEGKRFTCNICNRPFTRKSLLKQHKKIVHEGETMNKSEESSIVEANNSSIISNSTSDETMEIKNDSKVKPDPEILDFINDVETKVKNKHEMKIDVHENLKTPEENSTNSIDSKTLSTSENDNSKAEIDPEILDFVNDVKSKVKNKGELKKFIMEYLKTVDNVKCSTKITSPVENETKSLEIKTENNSEMITETRSSKNKKFKNEEIVKKSVEEESEDENPMDTPKNESLPRIPIPPRSDEKPKVSYSGLIAMAIQNLPDQKASSHEIFEWIKDTFPYYSR